MNRTCNDIMEIVREHGATGENIYWKRLAKLLKGTAAASTVHKYVRWLVNSEELEEQIVTSDGRIFKCFRIPDRTAEDAHPEIGEPAVNADAPAAKADDIPMPPNGSE